MPDADATLNELQAETARWRAKLEDRLDAAEAADAAGTDILENVRAYHDDADHFRADGDPVRAFEAVVWGWSWLEIGERLGHIQDA